MFASIGSGPSTSSSIQGSQPCRHFEFPEILLASKNYDESLVIGQGGFGKVYKGEIFSNGSSVVVVAIKRLDAMSNQGAAEFWAEVEMLSKLRHCNLVSLIGYCNYEKEMILVYEYMPNGTLEDHLHKRGTTLSWIQRLKICIGAGRGLHYLHTGTGIDVGVIHRDVKTSNILLHESWASKISDFGLSRISSTNQTSSYVNTVVKGTFGYLDPDYYATGKLTRKSDVYAFGVVLLEVLCRKRAVDRSLDVEQWNLARWAQESIKEENLKHIIDSDIRGQISTKCLKEFVLITERCLNNNPKKRSTMAEVVVSLESVLTVQEKINSSLQAEGRTIFGRLCNMFPFLSNRAKPALWGSSVEIVSLEFNGLSEARSFTFIELAKYTDNFSYINNIGAGRYGMVYRGSLPNGQLIAIKRPYLRSLLEFKTTIELLSCVHHNNIVGFIGFCNDNDEQILIHEYILNGSLKDILSGTTGISLDWMGRLKIALGVARGLQYLHDFFDPPVIHGDLKTNNILLDERLVAKVADFWVFNTLNYHDMIYDDRSNTQVRGTLGYLDPEYYMTEELTKKSDVYSFGVVMLELITARHPIEKGKYIVREVKQTMDRNKELYDLHKVLDPTIGLSSQLKGLETFVDLSLTCVEETGNQRPSMSKVVKVLESIIDLVATIPVAESSSSTSASYEGTMAAPWVSTRENVALEVNGHNRARAFTFEELKKYTNNFSRINNIGAGGFGMVYRGSLPNGPQIAIKRAQQGSRHFGIEFKTAIELLSGVHHNNIVEFIGFCFDNGEQMLVHEYIMNGTLKHILSGKSGIRLDWMRRLKIALGVAKGLQYLHDLVDPPVIHGNINTNNILLDERLVAKLADFCLSKPLSNDMSVDALDVGTLGYMDPEYYFTQKLTKKSDVFSFGVVMLELITARNPIKKGKFIVREVKEMMNRNTELYGLHKVLDPTIGLSSQLKGLETFVDLSLSCVEETGNQRPLLSKVVKVLESIITLVGTNPVTESSSSTSESYGGTMEDYIHPRC